MGKIREGRERKKGRKGGRVPGSQERGEEARGWEKKMREGRERKK